MKILAYGGNEIELSESVDFYQLRTAIADLIRNGGGWRDVSDRDGATHSIYISGSVSVRLTERMDRPPLSPVSAGSHMPPTGAF